MTDNLYMSFRQVADAANRVETVARLGDAAARLATKDTTAFVVEVITLTNELNEHAGRLLSSAQQTSTFEEQP